MTTILKAITFAFLCGGVLASCTGLPNTSPEGVPSYDDELTAVTISLIEEESPEKTKATSADMDENTVNGWFVLGFDASTRKLVFSYQPTGTSFSVYMNKTKITNLNIYAFANTIFNWTDYTTEDELMNEVFDLTDHIESGLIPMCKQFKNYNLSANPNLAISLERMYSKIMLTDLTCNNDLDGSQTDQCLTTLNAIYLINVHSSMLLGEFFGRTVPQWYTDGSQLPWFFHIAPCMCDADMELVMSGVSPSYPQEAEGYDTTGDSYVGSNMFGNGSPLLGLKIDTTAGSVDPSAGETIAYYCLPNYKNTNSLGTVNATKLVVHATVSSPDNGNWKGSYYYTVPIADPNTGTMAPNNVYRVSMTIHNLGFEYPDVDEGVETWCNSYVNSANWSNVTYSEPM